MKNLLFILILIFFATFSIIAQSPCPSISITAPKELVKIGDSMTFTAKIEGMNLENLKYKWGVSSGEIISGQGTLTINVAITQDMGGQTITATIQVIGLPENCPKEFYNSGEIELQILCGGRPLKFDEYKNISWNNEKIKLDDVVKAFNKEPDLKLVIRFTTKEKTQSKIFKARQLKIAKYLTENHKISKDRILFIIDNYRNDLTEIYLVPVGVEFPN